MPASTTRLTREENGRRVREALLRAATRVVARHGFAGASVQRITAACGVSQGTLYTYFGSLRELLDELLPSEGLLMLAALGRAGGADTGYFEQERRTFEALADYLRRKPWFMRLLTEAETAAPASHAQHYRNIEARYLRALRRGAAQRELRPQTDEAFRTVAGVLSAARGFVVTGFCERASRRLFHPPPLPDWAAGAYVRFVREGVGASGRIPPPRAPDGPPGPPGPQPAPDTRTRLLDAAARTIGRKGYAATRVVDVCAAAGLAVGTFYGHFAGRDDMLEAVLSDAHARLSADVARATQDCASVLEHEARSFDAWFAHVQRHPWLPRLASEGAVWAPDAYLRQFHERSDAHVADMRRLRQGDELAHWAEHELPLIAHVCMAARHDLATRRVLAGEHPTELPGSVRDAYLALVARGLAA